MRSTEARVLVSTVECDGFLGEGPRDASDPEFACARFAWVNIQKSTDPTKGSFYFASYEPQTAEVTQVDCPGRPGFLMQTADANDTRGHLLLGVEKRLLLWCVGTTEWSEPLAAIPDENPRTIINDGEVVPGGKAIVFGTKDTQFKEQIAALYLYTVDDNRVSLLADKQLCSNGKVIVKDERGLLLYDIDTPKRNVVRYRLDVAARTATLEGVALDLADQVGFPDGMCDCGDGTVIIAFYNPDFAEAGKAIRFNLGTGKAVEEWTTPGSPRVTCPLLVKRPEGVRLILTTATEGMPAEMREKCPNAGCLFIADTQLESCPEPELVRMP